MDPNAMREKKRPTAGRNQTTHQADLYKHCPHPLGLAWFTLADLFPSIHIKSLGGRLQKREEGEERPWKRQHGE